MHHLTQFERVVLAAYFRRQLRGTSEWHPAKAHKIAQRFPVVYRELDAAAKRSRGHWVNWGHTLRGIAAISRPNEQRHQAV